MLFTVRCTNFFPLPLGRPKSLVIWIFNVGPPPQYLSGMICFQLLAQFSCFIPKNCQIPATRLERRFHRCPLTPSVAAPRSRLFPAIAPSPRLFYVILRRLLLVRQIWVILWSTDSAEASFSSCFSSNIGLEWKQCLAERRLRQNHPNMWRTSRTTPVGRMTTTTMLTEMVTFARSWPKEMAQTKSCERW